VADLPQDYVEEEFFVEGLADLFSYEDPPVPGVIVPLHEDVPYRTRIIVTRPADPVPCRPVPAGWLDDRLCVELPLLTQ
jgi:hypothetical protein